MLRFANRVPVVLERVFIPCARWPNLEEWDLEKSSLQDLLTDAYHIQPGRISQTVESVVAVETVAQQLRVEEGFPLLMVSRVMYERGADVPVLFSQDFLRGDYARIHTDAELEERNSSIGEDLTGKEELGKSIA
jgi:GntR family transcriptional regulator